jgi:hypothetical protein
MCYTLCFKGLKTENLTNNISINFGFIGQLFYEPLLHACPNRTYSGIFSYTVLLRLKDYICIKTLHFLKLFFQSYFAESEFLFHEF